MFFFFLSVTGSRFLRQESQVDKPLIEEEEEGKNWTKLRSIKNYSTRISDVVLRMWEGKKKFKKNMVKTRRANVTIFNGKSQCLA